MYYSKRGSEGVAVPRNYSGSLFRVVDESDRTPPDRDPMDRDPPERKNSENAGAECRACTGACKKDDGGLVTLSHIFSGISVEELLLVGLMTVIHRDDPDDPILLVLLVLLMAR